MLRFGRDSRSAQPWLRPPRLRTLAEEDAEDERHASWLELFFDLVFVVAIAELAHELGVDHTLGGFATFAALFVPIFVAWQGFSFYADRFDTDDVLFRVCMLAAMLAVAALAIQIPDVAHGESTGFALAYVTIRVLTIVLNLRAYRHVPLARPLVGRYVVAFSFSVALWTASLAVPEPWRFVLWGIGLAVDLGVPARIGPRFVGRVPLHASHIPERFALFTGLSAKPVDRCSLHLCPRTDVGLPHSCFGGRVPPHRRSGVGVARRGHPVGTLRRRGGVPLLCKSYSGRDGARYPVSKCRSGHVPPSFYLTTSSSFTPSPPKNTLKRRMGRSDSIRSMGLAKDHEFNMRWLKAARRILKPDGTLWVTGTHHIIFSIGKKFHSCPSVRMVIGTPLWKAYSKSWRSAPLLGPTCFTSIKITGSRGGSAPAS